MAVDVERHRRPRVPGALGELPCGDARLVPDRDSAVPKIVRLVVGDLRVATRPTYEALSSRPVSPRKLNSMRETMTRRCFSVALRESALRRIATSQR